MKPNIVAFIFARGGSKGVLRKNIRPLAGKPLIAYSIETALACDMIDRVVVSTDDKEIAEVARASGAEVPFIRPAELADDQAPEWLAWQHAIQQIQTVQPMDVFVSLPCTSPLRNVEDIKMCIEAFLKGSADIMITVTPSERNPYFNMVKLDEDGHAKLVMDGHEVIHHRQNAPKTYDITTVAYIAQPDFILNNQGVFDGKIKAVVIPKERALDIDTEFDFILAEFLMTHQDDLAETRSR